MNGRSARVVVAYATVKVADPVGKLTVLGFPQNAILPPTADPDNVANLVRRGYAEWVDEPEPAAEEAPAETGRETPPAGDEDDGDKPPAKNAKKDEWVAYAVAHRPEGMSAEEALAEAEATSRDDLIAKYGG